MLIKNKLKKKLYLKYSLKKYVNRIVMDFENLGIRKYPNLLILKNYSLKMVYIKKKKINK